MTAFECTKTLWIETAFFGTLILSILFIWLIVVMPELIPFIFIGFIITLLWSLPQFILTVFTLEQIRKMNISVKQKIYWTTLATFVYSVLTAASFNYPIFSTLKTMDINSNMLLTILFLTPYIGVSAIIMYHESTIFYNQDKIP